MKPAPGATSGGESGGEEDEGDLNFVYFRSNNEIKNDIIFKPKVTTGNQIGFLNELTFIL